ncbi:MAG: putative ABC transporter permease [Oscillospiraceae bacterium]|nr:putative ABC transporter permease [Oscillospiraceae bacterium]
MIKSNSYKAGKSKLSKKAKLFRVLILWFFMGMIYLTIEGIWRGWTNIVMLPIGGLCGIAIGEINQMPLFYKSKMVWQSLIGAVIVLAVEFVSGCILNIWLGLGIWDYTGKFGNIYGQICIQYAILWFLLMPFAIWVEDYLRWLFWREGKPYNLLSIYKELFTLK